MFSTGFTSLSCFFFLCLSSSSSLCTVFDFISYNIDEVHLINPSAHVTVFGDFSDHHRDWLPYTGGMIELVNSCNFFITKDLTHMFKFPTRIPDCDSHNPGLLNLFLLILVFVMQWLSFHLEILIMLLFVSVSIDLLSKALNSL